MTNLGEKQMDTVRWWLEILTPVVAITLSYANICARLERIETTLHLPPYSAFNVVPDAQAHEYHVIEQPVLRTLDFKNLSNPAQIKGENNVR